MIWTHSICDICWVNRNGSRRAVRVGKPTPIDVCCFCGLSHQSGIYVRESQEKTMCTSWHRKEDDE